MIHYPPADCLEKDTCVLCGDLDIVFMDVLLISDHAAGPHELYSPYMLCADCAGLPSVTVVVEGALKKVMRRKDWRREPVQTNHNATTGHRGKGAEKAFDFLEAMGSSRSTRPHVCDVCGAAAPHYCDFGWAAANLWTVCGKWLCDEHAAVEAQVWDTRGRDGVDLRCPEHRAPCQDRTHLSAPCCAHRTDLQDDVSPYLRRLGQMRNEEEPREC
jgi:hypothetical protein